MTPANQQKKKTLVERIVGASQRGHYIHVTYANDEFDFAAMPVWLSHLRGKLKKHPDLLFLHSARLVGNRKDIDLLLTEEFKVKFNIPENVATVIEYDLSHPLTLDTIGSTNEKDYWGFDEKGELVKLGRKSYKDSFESELQGVTKFRSENKEKREVDQLSMDTFNLIVMHVKEKPETHEVFIPSAHSIKELGIGKVQKRPYSTKDLISRIKYCTEMGAYLNVTDMTEEGNGAKVSPKKPANPIVFTDIPELKNVFWTRKENDTSEYSKGAFNFLSRYWTLTKKQFDHSTVIRKIKCEEDRAPKIIKKETTKVAKPVFRVAKATGLSVEPQSPRNDIANYDGAGFGDE